VLAKHNHAIRANCWDTLLLYLLCYLGLGLLTLAMMLLDHWWSTRKPSELALLLGDREPKKNADYYIGMAAKLIFAPILAVIAWPYVLLVLTLSWRRERRKKRNKQAREIS